MIEQKMQVQGSLPLVELCQLSGVSRASYYRRWLAERASDEEMVVRDRLQQLALQHRHHGYRYITKLLKREGWTINHKRTLRLMREDNLLRLRRRKWVHTTESDHDRPIYPNMARLLKVQGPDQLWVADITYVRLRSEFVYVAILLDVFSRRVVGWTIGKNLDSSLTERALEKAIQARQPKPGLVHHSDRGWQYACNDYIAMLNRYGIEISMSRSGNPYDNAYAESFMKTLKTEEVDGRRYHSLEEAASSIETFIEVFYNQQRLHSKLGYLSPAEFEAGCTLNERGMLSIDGTREGEPPSLVLPSPARDANDAVRVD
ncbi:MAG TPA: IS3 family transposase [Candidatus Binatia bacterium]